ncbi:MAG: DUF368 domain-containing protein, partial [Fusobacteriaceae bacterium]
MLLLFLKGIIIGVANIMPGVSGGTLAVVLGIYDKLIGAIGNFITCSFKRKVEYLKFLTPIILGALTGILIFAKILQYLYINYPVPTGIGFMLLIIPSIPLIIKGQKFSNINTFSFFLGALLTLIFIILGVKYGVKTDNFGSVGDFSINYGIKLLLSGVVAAGAMIIPGISGSLLLLMIGEYYNILFSINATVKSLIEFLKGNSSLNFLQLLTEPSFLNLYFFVVGVILGIVGFSKFIDFMLKKYKGITLFFIDGIVVISLLQILMNIFPVINT